MSLLVFPLLILAALASYITGLGIAVRWHTPFPLEFAIAGALHGAWLLPAWRRASLPLVVICWTTTVWLMQHGIATLDIGGPIFSLALLLEGICLLIALSIDGAISWPDSLARWRRSRTDILTQLRMAEGILPWSRLCFRQFTVGSADTPLGSDYQRFAAALADAEHRLRVRLSRTAVPEQLRQSVLQNVSAIVAQAEASAAQRAIELEQQALAAAAVCRDQCEHLDDLTPPERRALAGHCEEAFLELARH